MLYGTLWPDLIGRIGSKNFLVNCYCEISGFIFFSSYYSLMLIKVII